MRKLFGEVIDFIKILFRESEFIIGEAVIFVIGVLSLLLFGDFYILFIFIGLGFLLLIIYYWLKKR